MGILFFDDLAIGEIPRVVGTLSTYEMLDRIARGEQAVDCDVLEVRLDKIGTEAPRWPELCEAAGHSAPVLLTIRDASEGGGWKSSEEERMALYERALPHVAAVDIEVRSASASDLVGAATDAKKACVLSYHDFSRTPQTAALEAILAEMAGKGLVVGKVATMVNDPDDLARLRSLLSADVDLPRCILPMGPMAAEDRVPFAAEGSCLTYGYLDESAAPGQLAVADLASRLAHISEAYAASRAGRHAG